MLRRDMPLQVSFRVNHHQHYQSTPTSNVLAGKTAPIVLGLKKNEVFPQGDGDLAVST